MKLAVRNRDKKGRVLQREVSLVAGKTAVLVMDVWDKHWCKDVNRRLPELLEPMNNALAKLRAQGCLILHMPADCMDFYSDFPQRRKVLEMKKRITSPLVYYGINHYDWWHGKFPIRLAEEGGCPCVPHCEKPMVWSRQHEAIDIAEEDYIAADPKEVYTLLKRKGIRHLLYMGVHANICILRRPVGIRKMKALGFKCILFRDLTDVLYDPANWPFVEHDEAKELVIRHIEERYCATASSADL